jgi:hypothetical protein
VSVRLKIEDSREGLVATISQRDDTGKVIGRPSVSLVGRRSGIAVLRNNGLIETDGGRRYRTAALFRE